MPIVIFTVVNDLTYDQRMHRICNSLARNGYDVLLIGRKLKSSIPLHPEIFMQKRLHSIFTRGKLFYIEYNLRLFFLLLTKKFHIVCGIDLDTILPCYFISVMRNKTCVYDAHELFPEVPEVVRRPAIQSLWRSVEKFSILRIKNCYTVSQSIADHFEKNYKRKFEVIRNMPVKTDEGLRKEIHLNPPVVLYQGTLNEGRGIEQMIDVMQYLDCRLILAGEGDLAASLIKTGERLKLEQKIIFAGMKTAAELRELTLQSTVGINLLENTGLSYYYSLANKFFDYAMAGIPQITMNFPEYRILNKQFEVAILIDDLKTETLLRAIHQLMDEKDFYIRLRENCLRAREEWNWQKEEIKLLSFYHGLQ
ncbi:MAG: glycosyltransferase [Chitinophagales bacterium]